LLSHDAIEKEFPGHRAKASPVIVSLVQLGRLSYLSLAPAVLREV
jgi:hypothetical protein